MTIPSQRAFQACLLLAALLLPGISVADQLIMKNGDVITGSISKISDGEVYIDPAYADEIAVALDEVASI
jgi:ribosomal protein S1